MHSDNESSIPSLKPVGWRERLFGKDRFGVLLLLILIQLVILSGFSHPGILLIAVLLQILSLFVALRSSAIPIRVPVFLGLWLAIFAVITLSILGLRWLIDSPNAIVYARIPAYSFVAVINLAIIVIIVRRIMQHAKINISTVLAALCIYLQIGLFFASIYAVLGAASAGNFFAGQTVDLQVIYVYFSYSCLTTVGFGDFVAGTNLGRMLAVSESILGQLYLVGGVALIVGRLGRSHPLK